MLNDCANWDCLWIIVDVWDYYRTLKNIIRLEWNGSGIPASLKSNRKSKRSMWIFYLSRISLLGFDSYYNITEGCQRSHAVSSYRLCTIEFASPFLRFWHLVRIYPESECQNIQNIFTNVFPYIKPFLFARMDGHWVVVRCAATSSRKLVFPVIYL